jgi:hypothetical protein
MLYASPICSFMVIFTPWTNPELSFLLFTFERLQGWRLWHVSCFGDDQDGPTTSDEGDGFKYVAQSQSSTGAEVKEKEGGSANEEQEQSFMDWDWLLQVQKASLVFLLTCL